MAKTKKVFRAAPHAGFTDEEAAVIGAHLECLKARNGQKLTPELMLKDARSPKSPLHKHVTWDRDRAALLHQLEQMRHLARSVVIEFVSPSGTKRTRYLHNVEFIPPGKEDSARAYMAVEDIENDPELREQVIENALKQLRGWQARYSVYRELFPVSKAIDKAIDNIRGNN